MEGALSLIEGQRQTWVCSRAEKHQQNNAEFLIGISLAGLSTRVRQLTEAVVSLVNKNNPHAGPPVARALFEACCVPVYLHRELVPRVEKSRVNAVQRVVFRLGLGETGALAGGHVKPIAVDALVTSARSQLKQLEESVPEKDQIDAGRLIDIYYGPLSDLTHPNWGALSLGTELGMPPRFTSPARFDDPVMHSVVSSTAWILQAGGRSLDETLLVLRERPLDLPNAEPEWLSGETRAT